MPDNFPNAYALLVGVGQSAYPKLSLPVTVKDMQALKVMLCDPALCGYEEQHTRLLHDNTATKAAILDGLNWLQSRAEQDSDATVLVFYSGHGWRKKENDRYYLLQHDIDPLDLEKSALDAQACTPIILSKPSKARAISPAILSCICPI